MYTDPRRERYLYSVSVHSIKPVSPIHAEVSVRGRPLTHAHAHSVPSLATTRRGSLMHVVLREHLTFVVLILAVRSPVG
jgi:hypothetical protein